MNRISGNWPGLPSTFTSDIEAACAVPNSRDTEVYLFKGNQYVRYNVRRSEAMSGPKLISADWSGLANIPFVSNLHAACRVPGSTTEVYLFKDDRYVRYVA